ncbi:MAG: hypothetical protein JSV42_05510 [Chloroflexota bacterium]|nr:MAG: hypothetical protein JSV42_05510 [Chloroflexota bacterium]
MESRNPVKLFLDPWLIIGAIGFGIALLVATLLLLSWTRSPQSVAGESTPTINIIALNTSTPIIPTASPGITEIPSETNIPPPPPGDIAIGAYVKVTGTGGDGLRLRVGPGLEREVRLLGGEDEVFLIQDGPQLLDSYTWWYLVGPFDETRHGWAVANFLQLIQKP